MVNEIASFLRHKTDGSGVSTTSGGINIPFRLKRIHIESTNPTVFHVTEIIVDGTSLDLKEYHPQVKQQSFDSPLAIDVRSNVIVKGYKNESSHLSFEELTVILTGSEIERSS